MEYNLKEYPLSMAILVFFVSVILLGAPAIGLLSLLVGAYMVYRSPSATSRALNTFLRWLNRNRYLLVLAIVISLLSGFLLVSSSLQTRVYGFPVAFIVYYPPTPEFSGPIRILSSIALNAPEFFLNVVGYYVLAWGLVRLRNKFTQAA